MANFKDYGDRFIVSAPGHKAEAVFNGGWDGGAEIWLSCSCGWNGVTVDRSTLEDDMVRVKEEYRNFYERYGGDVYQACQRIYYGGDKARVLALGQLVEHTGVNIGEELHKAKVNYEKLSEEFNGDCTSKVANRLKGSIDLLVAVDGIYKDIVNYRKPIFVKVPHEAAMEWKEFTGYSYDLR